MDTPNKPDTVADDNTDNENEPGTDDTEFDADAYDAILKARNRFLEFIYEAFKGDGLPHSYVPSVVYALNKLGANTTEEAKEKARKFASKHKNDTLFWKVILNFFKLWPPTESQMRNTAEFVTKLFMKPGFFDPISGTITKVSKSRILRLQNLGLDLRQMEIQRLQIFADLVDPKPAEQEMMDGLKRYFKMLTDEFGYTSSEAIELVQEDLVEKVEKYNAEWEATPIGERVGDRWYASKYKFKPLQHTLNDQELLIERGVPELLPVRDVGVSAEVQQAMNEYLQGFETVGGDVIARPTIETFRESKIFLDLSKKYEGTPKFGAFLTESMTDTNSTANFENMRKMVWSERLIKMEGVSQWGENGTVSFMEKAIDNGITSTEAEQLYNVLKDNRSLARISQTLDVFSELRGGLTEVIGELQSSERLATRLLARALVSLTSTVKRNAMTAVTTKLFAVSAMFVALNEQFIAAGEVKAEDLAAAIQELEEKMSKHTELKDLSVELSSALQTLIDMKNNELLFTQLELFNNKYINRPALVAGTVASGAEMSTFASGTLARLGGTVGRTLGRGVAGALDGIVGEGVGGVLMTEAGTAIETAMGSLLAYVGAGADGVVASSIATLTTYATTVATAFGVAGFAIGIMLVIAQLATSAAIANKIKDKNDQIRAAHEHFNLDTRANYAYTEDGEEVEAAKDWKEKTLRALSTSPATRDIYLQLYNVKAFELVYNYSEEYKNPTMDLERFLPVEKTLQFIGYLKMAAQFLAAQKTYQYTTTAENWGRIVSDKDSMSYTTYDDNMTHYFFDGLQSRITRDVSTATDPQIIERSMGEVGKNFGGLDRLVFRVTYVANYLKSMGQDEQFSFGVMDNKEWNQIHQKVIDQGQSLGLKREDYDTLRDFMTGIHQEELHRIDVENQKSNQDELLGGIADVLGLDIYSEGRVDQSKVHDMWERIAEGLVGEEQIEELKKIGFDVDEWVTKRKEEVDDISHIRDKIPDNTVPPQTDPDTPSPVQPGSVQPGSNQPGGSGQTYIGTDGETVCEYRPKKKPKYFIDDVSNFKQTSTSLSNSSVITL